MKQRILYIEDELILGQLVKDALEKHGFEVLKVINGSDGLAMLILYAGWMSALCHMRNMSREFDGRCPSLLDFTLPGLPMWLSNPSQQMHKTMPCKV